MPGGPIGGRSLILHTDAHPGDIQARLRDVSPLNDNRLTTTTVSDSGFPTERTFHPTFATGATVQDARDFQTIPGPDNIAQGWALTLDDTEPSSIQCNAYIPPQTMAVQLRIHAENSNGLSLGSNTIRIRGSFWSVNPLDADDRTLIQAWSASNTSNIAGPGALGAFGGNAIDFNLNAFLPDGTTIPRGRVLYLQLGFEATNIASPSIGSNTATFRVRLHDTESRIFLSLSGGMRRVCTETLEGEGIGSGKMGIVVKVGLDSKGAGASTVERAFTALRHLQAEGIGDGAVSRRLEAGRAFDAEGAGSGTVGIGVAVGLGATGVGQGAMNRVSSANRSFEAVGVGQGRFDRHLDAKRSLDAEGVGVGGLERQVTFVRTFGATGVGMIRRDGFRICLPAAALIHVPEGEGGTTVVRRTYIFGD